MEKNKEYFRELNLNRLFLQYKPFYIEVDNLPVEIDCKIDKVKDLIKIPIYRKRNSVVYTDDYVCNPDFFCTTLVELIPLNTFDSDLSSIFKDNFYRILQNHILESNYMVDEVFEVFIGIFIMASDACSRQLAGCESTIEELEDAYSNIYNIYRDAIPDSIFMKYSR